MGTRNKTAGSIWERKCVEYLRHIYPDALTTRNANARLDGKGVDICNEDGTKLPVNIQCKTLSSKPNYIKVLDHMPDGDINIFLLKRTSKDSSGRFMNIGEYCILRTSTLLVMLGENSNISDDQTTVMPLEDGLKLIEKYERARVLRI